MAEGIRRRRSGRARSWAGLSSTWTKFRWQPLGFPPWATRSRRRRKIGELIKPEEQKQVLPVEENSAEPRTNDERRRRRRISSSLEPEEPKPSVPVEESISKTETEEITNQSLRKSILVMRQGIDEIRAELGEERSSALLESDYWDETHSWGADDEGASDEYWHFVGRYE